MFRKTIDYKGGDKGTIVDYSRNLLHKMAPDAQPFSIRSGVLERGPSRVVDLHHTSCI
jgi:hypothetical protein